MRCIIALSKNPFETPVKTRLAHDTNTVFAQKLYLCFLKDLKTKIKALNIPLYLGYLPATSKSKKDLEHIFGSDAHYFPQTGDDLGARMHHAFTQQYHTGYKQVLLMGCDCPDLPLTHITDAFESLKDHDIAICPLKDGGYAFMAATASGFLDSIFSWSSWESPNIYQTTKQELLKQGRSLFELPAWQDVDDLKDLKALLTRNSNYGDNVLSETLHYIRQQHTMHQAPFLFD